MKGSNVSQVYSQGGVAQNLTPVWDSLLAATYTEWLLRCFDGTDQTCVKPSLMFGPFIQGCRWNWNQQDCPLQQCTKKQLTFINPLSVSFHFCLPLWQSNQDLKSGVLFDCFLRTQKRVQIFLRMLKEQSEGRKGCQMDWVFFLAHFKRKRNVTWYWWRMNFKTSEITKLPHPHSSLQVSLINSYSTILSLRLFVTRAGKL